MKTGISLYPGLDNTAEENQTLLDTAARLGLQCLFTSLHIPEADTTALKKELQGLLEKARAHGMEVISDISPRTLSLLDLPRLSPQALLERGITTARFDFGYDAAAIARFSRDMRVQLNASTLTDQELQELDRAHADFSRIDGLHNFYPRPHTGLAVDFFLRKTRLLQKAGIATGAFIPSQWGRRGPLKKGLPTLELHRSMEAGRAARHLAALGLDMIILSDSRPSETELMALSRIRSNTVILQARLLTEDPVVRELLEHTFTARPDGARDVIRAQESRGLLEKGTIAPDPTADWAKHPGDITVDNAAYGRYMGEVQISRLHQEPCEGTNTAARIIPEDRFLLACITPGKSFRFQFI